MKLESISFGYNQPSDSSCSARQFTNSKYTPNND